MRQPFNALSRPDLAAYKGVEPIAFGVPQAQAVMWLVACLELLQAFDADAIRLRDLLQRLRVHVNA